MILTYDPGIILKVQITGHSYLNGNCEARYERARPSSIWKENGTAPSRRLCWFHVWESVHIICHIAAELKRVDKGSFLESKLPSVHPGDRCPCQGTSLEKDSPGERGEPGGRG